MFNTDDIQVRRGLLSGNFGLEKEMLRITEDGYLSHSSHPFPENEPRITRDFCENQTEINTPIFKSAGEVVSDLYAHTSVIIGRLRQLSPGEYLWPFSNPPYIREEEDIPVAQFHGTQQQKTRYREYLSNRYGRYKMTFSGIHFNYSFAGDLLRRTYQVETGIHMEKGKEDSRYRNYENRIYLALAEKLVIYGWIMVTLTAASPLMDSSFFETGRTGGTSSPVSPRSDVQSWATGIHLRRYLTTAALGHTPVAYSSMSMTDGLWLLRSSINMLLA